MIPIGPDTRVTLHFALKLSADEVVDSNLEGEPATFDVGDGNLLPGFEQALFGLLAGDQRTLTVPAERAFGPRNPDNVQRIAADRFPGDEALQPGMVMSFSDAGNGELPGVIVEIDERYVTVDFNHPLAGRDILFEVRILDVQPARTH